MLRSVLRVVHAKPQKIAGLYRVIGTVDALGQGTEHTVADVNPFILFDEGLIKGVGNPPFGMHPHHGMAACSYITKGAFETRDNKGDAGTPLVEGGVYLLCAGRGAAHAESSTTEEARAFQLIFLQSREEAKTNPRSGRLGPAEIPQRTFGEGGVVRVMVGAGFGLSSPLAVSPTVFYSHVLAPPNTDLPPHLQADGVPEDYEGWAYVVEGEVRAGEHVAKEKDLIVFGPGKGLAGLSTGAAGAEVLLGFGRPIREEWVKVLGGNGFVIAPTQADAEQIMAKYHADTAAFNE